MMLIIESGVLDTAVQLAYVIVFALNNPAQAAVGVIAIQFHVRPSCLLALIRPTRTGHRTQPHCYRRQMCHFFRTFLPRGRLYMGRSSWSSIRDNPAMVRSRTLKAGLHKRCDDVNGVKYTAITYFLQEYNVIQLMQRLWVGPIHTCYSSMPLQVMFSSLILYPRLTTNVECTCLLNHYCPRPLTHTNAPTSKSPSFTLLTPSGICGVIPSPLGGSMTGTCSPLTFQYISFTFPCSSGVLGREKWKRERSAAITCSGESRW